jgi:hypothetical protein
LVSWGEPSAPAWRLDDLLSGDTYQRDGSELRERGLELELGPWQCHLFLVRALPGVETAALLGPER